MDIFISCYFAIIRQVGRQLSCRRTSAIPDTENCHRDLDSVQQKQILGQRRQANSLNSLSASVSLHMSDGRQLTATPTGNVKNTDLAEHNAVG